MTVERTQAMQETERDVVDVLRSTFDPEIPVNIYDLGLVYEVEVNQEGDVDVRMTLTAPTCPVAGTMPVEIVERLERVPGVRKANVHLVWDPPWSPDRMSEAARLQLGFMD